VQGSSQSPFAAAAPHRRRWIGTLGHGGPGSVLVVAAALTFSAVALPAPAPGLVAANDAPSVRGDSSAGLLLVQLRAEPSGATTALRKNSSGTSLLRALSSGEFAGIRQRLQPLEMKFSVHAESLAVRREQAGVGNDVENCDSAPLVGAAPNTVSADHLRRNETNGWLSAKAETTVTASSPKLAVLMMIYSRIAFPKAWQTMLEGAPKGSVALLIHSKSKDVDVPAFFAPYVLKEMFPNARCQAVYLMTMMISIAMLDTAVTHFAVVSGDTLPLRRMIDIISDLREEPRSRFCVDPDWQRAETWFVMNRDLAHLLTNNTDAFHDYIVTLDMRCPDEDSFYRAFTARDEQLVDHCPMMTDWSGTQKHWRHKTDLCSCPTLLEKSEKARATCGHPATFHTIAPEGLQELLSSPARHWFFRKFPGDSPDNSSDSALVLDSKTGFSQPLDEAMASVLK